MAATPEALAALPEIVEVPDEFTDEYPVDIDSPVEPAKPAETTDPTVDPTNTPAADPVVDPAADPADDKSGEKGSEVDKGAMFDSLVEAYTKNPVGYISEMIRNGNLTPDQCSN